MPQYHAARPKTPCPWCGVVPRLCWKKDPLSANGRVHWIECAERRCGMQEVSTRDCDTSFEAVQLWETMAVTIVTVVAVEER